MTTPLHDQTCTPQAGAPLSEQAIKDWLTQVPGWQTNGHSHDASIMLSRCFSFADFHATMAFVNAVANMANAQDHHPDMHVSYKHCIVNWQTHSVKGLSISDFICAAKTNRCFDAVSA
jgi:4a-hydroxytetrahydrobiopterin dehydratase